MGHFDHKFRVGQFYLPKSESEPGERSTRRGRQYIYWTCTSGSPNCREGSREKVFIVFCKWSSQEGIWTLTPNSTRIWVEMGRICGSPKAYLGVTMTGNFGTKVSASANFRVKKVSLSDTCRYQFSHPFHGEKSLPFPPTRAIYPSGNSDSLPFPVRKSTSLRAIAHYRIPGLACNKF